MKEEDLMIGDLVKMNAGPARITAIKEGEIHFVDRFGRGISPDCEGLPITPEILEKNGFNYVKETGYMCYEQLGDRQYNLIAVKGNILQMQFTSGNLEWTECRYVHDLQHALRLCGISKEIVL